MTRFAVPQALETWRNTRTGQRVRIAGRRGDIVHYIDPATRQTGWSPLRAFVHRTEAYYTREEPKL